MNSFKNPSVFVFMRADVLRLFLISVGLLALSITATAKPVPPIPSDTSSVFEDALARANTGDFAAAVIQLKNVLQAEPNNLPARIALGQMLLRQGQAISAEKELRIALGLGALPAQVLPVLGNALLAQRKYQQILDTVRSKDPASEGRFEILLLRARAHYELGRLDSAEALFEKARLKEEKRPEPLIGLSQVQRSRGNLEKSLQLNEQAVSLAPSDSESWFQKGETLLASGKSDAAFAAYDQALKLSPGSLRARLSRAALYLAVGKTEQARDDAQFVRDANSEDLMAAFLIWQATSKLGNYQEANESLAFIGQQLGKIKDEALMREPYLLRIAAWFSYARKDLARCDRYLSQFVTLNPHDPNMQILLGKVKLQLGEPKSAISVLFPLAQRYPNNLEILLPLGQAYFKIGNYGEAAAMFERAGALAPDSAMMQAQLALSQVGLGRWDDAISGLKKADSVEDRAVTTGLLLTVLQLKGGEQQAALETISELAARSPTAAVLNMLGIMQASNGNLVQARQSFEKALAQKSGFVPADYNLAKLEFANGDLEGATKRLQGIAQREPRSSAALLGLADIATAQRDAPGAVGWLEKAVAVAPDNVDAHVRLIELYLSLNKNVEALNAARRLSQSKPENPDAIEALARAQSAVGKTDEARRNFRTAVRYAGYNGPQLLRIAQQQVLIEDYEEAHKTLEKATQSTMVETDAMKALTRLEIRLGNFAPAQTRIAVLAEKPTNQVLAHKLTAELYKAQDRVAETIAEYEAAQKVDPTSEGMLGLFDALDSAGRRDEAIARLEKWSAAHPGDIEVQRKLALWYLPTNQLDKAKALHERLLKNNPDDPVLLSNLARLYQLQKDKRARGLAERAVAAMPTWPVALDTLGWILITEGETERGLRFLREAISRDNNPLTRYHLAQALQELGRTDEAKIELQTIINAGKPADLVKDVQRYYDALANKK